MIATKEIIPGFKLPDNELVICGTATGEYEQLPAWRSQDLDGRIVCRFKLTWKEKFNILFGGSLWISILTFGRTLQPILIETTCPLQGSAMLDEET